MVGARLLLGEVKVVVKGGVGEEEEVEGSREAEEVVQEVEVEGVWWEEVVVVEEEGWEGGKPSGSSRVGAPALPSRQCGQGC
jgi:hypothetical protein